MYFLTCTALLSSAIISLVQGAPNPGSPPAFSNGTGKYIVQLKADLNASQVESHALWVSDIHLQSLGPSTNSDLPNPVGVVQTYGFDGFSAYSGSFHESVVAQIKASNDVAIVEPDGPIHLHWDKAPLNERGLQGQGGAPWGLGRLSHRYTNDTTYFYDSSAGQG
ncbi:MAG: hypothetical protein Q9227_003698 [Pyrenula ochraceoflavens]